MTLAALERYLGVTEKQRVKCFQKPESKKLQHLFSYLDCYSQVIPVLFSANAVNLSCAIALFAN
ncbi:MAG: hypothetical protein V7K67_28830 [Nostoc sp.]|uniref:hypothetical protein n=1 Tax=Nostoc sp. TaxID=1180 RepID=UPI002FF6EE4B